MPHSIRLTIFSMFLISGFCGLLYQVVWIRMAYASFGIITPVMSVVISVFMLGLLLGSALGGPIIKKLTKHLKLSAILFYALIEFFIGIGAFCVPKMFSLEQHGLLTLGNMDSFGYLLFSGLAITAAILPWCVLMGFTYPFMMAFVSEYDTTNTSSFSFLYLANVIGAMCGTVVTAVVLIELFGFINTLTLAAVCNFTIAAGAMIISKKYTPSHNGAATTPSAVSETDRTKGHRFILILLFINGFASLGMEIIWTRNFTTVLKTVIYSYASLLTTYLLATWIGSYLYRKHLSKSKILSTEMLLGAISLFSLLPLVLNDPRLNVGGIPRVLLSIFPLCGALGYLTPQLIDNYAKGSPSAAGWAYAINTLGCILGPLFASYLFLPWWGVKVSLLVLSVLLMACFFLYHPKSLFKQDGSFVMAVLSVLLLFTAYFFNDTYEEKFAHSHFRSVMRRDYAATVTSIGAGADKQILVNGIGMTYLTPITQFMAHLPLAYCEQQPASALVICFGMGTTFRSLVSWGINSTAVELIPSVPRTFGYFWPDADSVLRNPRAEVIIDDGRRYLMRTNKTFDVITLDPPPPVEAAGSSLLYSVEFYSLAKQRLKEGGIVQQWLPGYELSTLQAVARSLAVSFPYVKVFHSIEGWGYHFLASLQPFKEVTATEMVSRMPAKARQDLLTWCSDQNLEGYMAAMLLKEIPLQKVLARDPKLIITDARPYNEYFLLRRLFKNQKRSNNGIEDKATER